MWLSSSNLNHQDISSAIFEKYREAIRENIQTYTHDTDELYTQTYVKGEASDNFLSNTVEALQFISSSLYILVKSDILDYINAEVDHDI